MGNDRARGQRQRQAGDRLEHVDVVDPGAGRILEAAHALPRSRDFAADRQDRRAVGPRGGERSRHVENARAADSEAHAETARGPRIAVGHVGGAAFERGDDRPQALGSGQRRHEIVVQAAKVDEAVAHALIAQRGKYVVCHSHEVDTVLGNASRPPARGQSTAIRCPVPEHVMNAVR